MLAYDTPEQLQAESPATRYLHLTILGALRDHATQLEFRFAEEWILVYQRLDGRDWELLPPPEDVVQELKAVVRNVSRLVRPERPETTFTGLTIGGARVESPEVGWLTYRFGSDWIDLLVQIDPREPGGFIRLDLGDPAPFAGPAGMILSQFFEHESNSDEP